MPSDAPTVLPAVVTVFYFKAVCETKIARQRNCAHRQRIEADFDQRSQSTLTGGVD
jgi:hypothetical protein